MYHDQKKIFSFNKKSPKNLIFGTYKARCYGYTAQKTVFQNNKNSKSYDDA